MLKNKGIKTVISVLLAGILAFSSGSLLFSIKANSYISLPYIEEIKENKNESGQAFTILEIAPSDIQGSMGYYALGQEPYLKFFDKLSGYNNGNKPTPVSRSAYLRNIYSALATKGIIGTGDTAPVKAGTVNNYYFDSYKEFYPWQLEDTDGFTELVLENPDIVTLRGYPEAVNEGEGNFTFDKVYNYVPDKSGDSAQVIDGFKYNDSNLFDIEKWADTPSSYFNENVITYEIDKENDTIKVNGNGDCYSQCGNIENAYIVEVKPETIYTVSFLLGENTTGAQMHIFGYNDNSDTYFDRILNSSDYTTDNNSHIYFNSAQRVVYTFKTTAEDKYIQFRFGSTEENGVAEFSDFRIEETGNYYYNFTTTEYSYRSQRRIPEGSQVYTKNDAGIYEFVGIYGPNVNLMLDISETYYVIDTISDPSPLFIKGEYEYSSITPNMFEKLEEGENGFFKETLTDFKYVGEEKGDYTFRESYSSPDTYTLEAPVVFYKTGLTNNEWFKRFALDYSINDSFSVAVATATPDAVDVINHYYDIADLIVITPGSGFFSNEEFKEDISDETAALLREARANGTAFVIDSRVSSLSLPNLKAIAEDFTSNVPNGGVDKNIYCFNHGHVGAWTAQSCANNFFNSNLGLNYYYIYTSPYYPVYKQITDENFLRKNARIELLPVNISEATSIRYVINYKGVSAENKKEVINVLDIEPYTHQPSITEDDVKNWFPENSLYYTKGFTQSPCQINIHAMSTAEFIGKNENITENYDLIYIGASTTNMYTKEDEDGVIVPDYNDNTMDGMYYTNIGDTIVSGDDGLLERPTLAGLLNKDYDKTLFTNLWWVSAGTTHLKASGNDITEKKLQELNDCADKGIPVVISDRLMYNSLDNLSISVKLTGSVAEWYTTSSNVYKPKLRLTADIVLPEGQTLPEGIEPYFEWHCVTPDNVLTADEEDYRNGIEYADIDGDGINECTFTYTFNEGHANRGFGDFFVVAGFKSSDAKYYDLKNFAVKSNVLTSTYEDVDYTFSLGGSSGNWTADFALKDSNKYMPGATVNGGYMNDDKNFVFAYSSNEHTANDNVKMSWEVTSTYLAAFDETNQFTVSESSTRYHSVCTKTQKYVRVKIYVNDKDPTATIGNQISYKKNVDCSVRYYVFNEKTPSEVKTTPEGTSVYPGAFDNCSRMYEFIISHYNKYDNFIAKSETHKTQNKTTLLNYLNISSPSLNVYENSVTAYPHQITNGQLSFKFYINNPTDPTPVQTRYTGVLYVDVNADGKFSEEEQADYKILGGETLFRGSTSTRKYDYNLVKYLPNGLAGAIAWKFVVYNADNSALHASYENYAYVKPSEPKQIKAIQILPGDWDAEWTKLAGTSEANAYSENLYKGSVFYGDNSNQDAFKQLIDDPHSIISREVYNNGHDGLAHVIFHVNGDFDIDIAITNVKNLNNEYTKGEKKLLDTFDMLILGFGDSYSKLALSEKAALDLAYITMGFNLEATLAIEDFIDSGRSVLFCHDTTSTNTNFVNYMLNKVGSKVAEFVDSAVQWLTNLWNRIWGNEVDERDVSVVVAESRVKQGYYSNLILREKLGLDRYGISYAIKKKANYNYTDNGLKNGHKDNELAQHGVTLSELDKKGFSINWTPNSAELDAEGVPVKNNGILNAQESVFAQGFTRHTLVRYANKATNQKMPLTTMSVNGYEITRTNKISQVNKGQITTYPYNINVENMDTDTIDIGVTHEQYFQCNIDNDDLTVWYCLAGDHYNDIRNDCTNNYYIYSRGNITYTGAGHTNVFSVDEAKLFINTIIASYHAGITAPSILFTDEEGRPSHYKYIWADVDKQTNEMVFLSGEEGNTTIHFTIENTNLTKQDISVRFFYRDRNGDEIDMTDRLEGLPSVYQTGSYSFELPEEVIEYLNEKVLFKIYAKASITVNDRLYQSGDYQTIVIPTLSDLG